MTEMNLQSYLSERRALIDGALGECLPPDDRYPEELSRAMRYGVLEGGKRLRPILTLAGCEAVGGDVRAALPAACAIELVHAFSLIHDDLPAMDDDDLRRGKPTVHKAFGEAMAILAGDALLALAFETVISNSAGALPEVVLEVTRRIASAAGINGMVSGQVVDILSEGKKTDARTLELMHRRKTGVLIEASVTCGGLMGGGTPEQTERLGAYGRGIGIAFQIADDILDLEGEEHKIGKPVGSDLRHGKATYPALHGLEESRRLARTASEEAIEALDGFDEGAEPLRLIARLIVEREE